MDNKSVGKNCPIFRDVKVRIPLSFIYGQMRETWDREPGAYGRCCPHTGGRRLAGESQRRRSPPPCTWTLHDWSCTAGVLHGWTGGAGRTQRGSTVWANLCRGKYTETSLVTMTLCITQLNSVSCDTVHRNVMMEFDVVIITRKCSWWSLLILKWITTELELLTYCSSDCSSPQMFTWAVKQEMII